MKTLIGACVLLFFLGGARADDIDDFVASVNSSWIATNNVELATAISNRLESIPNDVLALSVKMYYWVFADCSISNARHAADSFAVAVMSSTNQPVRLLASEMTNQIGSISLSESEAFSASEVSSLRASFPESFPMIEKCEWMARTLDE